MTPASYTPSKQILEKYANLIVEFGLQNRDGSKPKAGAVVHFIVPEVARPLYFHLEKSILKHGYQPLGEYLPSNDEVYNLDEMFFGTASPSQRTFALNAYKKGLVDQADCVIRIDAESSPHALKDIPSEYILEYRRAQKKNIDYKWKKIESGKLNWTIALYGTEAMAKEAGLTLKQYWRQIIKACYLDEKNPTKEWFRINKTVQGTAKKLTKLAIESLHITGKDVDLVIGIGANRQWLAGGGNNIPSFEVFTSPNWREVNGWIRFNQPLYVFGSMIEGIELHFKNGEVVQCSAKKNQSLLQQIIETKGGNRLGEVSLTDARISRITKFMADTLYDENVGGKYGNTHVALGSAFRECLLGIAPKSDKDWDKLGFNDSVVHHDIVSTTDRTVTATLKDGKKKVIYEKGQFTI
jgi:aminopeptidase